MKIENFLGGFSRWNFTRILMNFYIPKKGPTFKNQWFFQYKLVNFTCWLHSGSHQTTIQKSTILGPKNNEKSIKNWQNSIKNSLSIFTQFWNDFRPNLGPLWEGLGTILGDVGLQIPSQDPPQPLPWPIFTHHLCLDRIFLNFGPILDQFWPILDRFGTNLGPKWASNWPWTLPESSQSPPPLRITPYLLPILTPGGMRVAIK